MKKQEAIGRGGDETKNRNKDEFTDNLKNCTEEPADGAANLNLLRHNNTLGALSTIPCPGPPSMKFYDTALLHVNLRTIKITRYQILTYVRNDTIHGMESQFCAITR